MKYKKLLSIIATFLLVLQFFAPVSKVSNVEAAETETSILASFDALTKMAQLSDAQLTFLMNKAETMLTLEIFPEERALLEAKGVTTADMQVVINAIKGELIDNVSAFRTAVNDADLNYLITFADNVQAAIPAEVKTSLNSRGLSELYLISVGLELLTSGLDFFSIDTQTERDQIEQIFFGTDPATNENKEWLASYGINYANLEEFLAMLDETEKTQLQGIIDVMSAPITDQAEVINIAVSSNETASNNTFYLNAGDTITVDVTLSKADSTGLSVSIGSWKTLTAGDFQKQTTGNIYRWQYTVQVGDTAALSAITATLNGTKTATNKVVVDNQASIISVYSEKDNKVIPKDAAVNLLVVTDSDAQSVKAVFSNGTASVDKILTKQDDRVYTTSYTPTVATGELKNYTVTVTMTDITGNDSAENNDISFTVDAKAPVISGLNVDTPAGEVEGTLTGSVDEQATVKVFKVIGANKSLISSTTETGAFSIAVPLSHGVNSFEVTATDLSGNKAPSAPIATTNLDFMAPYFTYNLNSGELTITSNEAIPGALTVTGTDVTFTKNSNTTWTSDSTFTGDINIAVEGTDDNGNVGYGTYVAKSITPGAAATLGGGGIALKIKAGSITGDTPVQIGVSDAANTGAATAELENTGTTVTKAIEFKPDGITFAEPVTIEIPFDKKYLPEGFNKTTFDGLSLAEQKQEMSQFRVVYLKEENGTWVTEDYTNKISGYIIEPTQDKYIVQFETTHFSTYGSAVDNTPPVLTVTQESGEDTSNDGVFTVSGDTEPGAEVVIKVKNEAGSVTQTYSSASDFTVSGDGTFSTNVQLNTDEVNTIVIESTDDAGNKATDSINITHDSPAPTNTTITVQDNITTENNTYTVTGTISSTGTVISRVWEAGEQGDTLNSNNFSFTVSLSNGTNSISIVAVTADGKTTTKTITITKIVDTNTGGGSSGGSGGDSSSPSTPTETVDEGDIDDQLDSDEKEVTVKVAKGREDVKVTADVIKKIVEAGKDLVIQTEKVTFKLPAAALDLDNEDLTLTAEEASDSATDTAAGYKPVGKVYEINAKANNDKVTFKNKIKVSLSFDGLDLDNVNVDKLGVYWLNEETETWEFVGGKVNKDTKTVEFLTGHFSKYTIMEYNKTFIDLDGHWAKDEVELMASKHIINGTSDATYSPGRQISRAEFAALLVRTLGLEASEESTLAFTDVSADAWYYSEVAAAFEAGIINGQTETTFAPKANITRQEMAVMVARALAASGVNAELTAEAVKDKLAKFNDATRIADWAEAEVATAAELGIINGRTETTFVPTANATRAESAVMIYRMYNQLP